MWRHAVGGPSLEGFVNQVYLPRARGRKRSWAVDERIARRYIGPVFGERRLRDITPAEVDAWLTRLRATGLAPATCNRIFAVLRGICGLAVRQGLLEVSPCARVSPFPPTPPREQHLSTAAGRRLLARLEQSGRPEALALRLLLLTGGRKSEILRARWEDVHLSRRVLTVPLSKSGRARHIALSRAAVAVIRAIPRQQGNPWLFPGRVSGKPLSDLYLFWNKLRQELDLGSLRIHDLRHSFASFLVNGGHTLFETQNLLGHTDPRTTMRYAHLGWTALLEATETVSRVLSGNKSVRSKAGRR